MVASLGGVRRLACLAMVFKRMQLAQTRWRALNGSKLIPGVISGVQFVGNAFPQGILSVTARPCLPRYSSAESRSPT